MSGSLLASAPPLTVIQNKSAGATRQMTSQERTDPQATPRTRSAGASCPARMQTPKRKGISMSVQPMPGPVQQSSAELQTKTFRRTDMPVVFCTTKLRTATNSRDADTISLPEPHASLAGHPQEENSDHPRATTNKNRTLVQSTSTTAAISKTKPVTAANTDEIAEIALCKQLAFLAGPGRTTGQPPWKCEARDERAPAPQRARPPTPSFGSATNSAASPRRAQIRELLHTLQGCCDGQQHGSSNALRARLPVTMRASAHRVLSHMMMEMTTIVMIMMRLIAKMNLTMSAIMTMIATSGSNSPRGSRRYPAPEPKHEPAGPSPAPAALCTRTRAAQATQPVPPKPSENGITYQSSAAEAAATHSSISRRHAAKPALKAEQTSILGTGVEDRPALTTTDAIDSQNGNSLKLIKSTVGRDYWLAGQLTEQTTRSTCTTKNTRAREQPKHDKQQNAQPPDFAALAAAARRALAATALAIMNLRETETE